ncbi:ABC transporter ATP-binding protein [Leifsonia shinshuensis]|uniref:ABC transporter ATP-binding protein n=1 Tax=Leifsonia shinshuensis TaxID=150026 RepID=UPI001F512183|nr:ABC transporter ATP-binding protein [Leifsonia shinshuensis]MCI0159373.1 ABC transporter ATP-binding protein [Leifsonia shinshuensis]
MTAILDIQDATVEYSTRGTLVRALDGATLRVEPGETVGIVGESGSGKSTLGLLCGRLLPANATVTATRALVDGAELLGLDNEGIRRLRRECLGFIPQDPVAALDPTMRIGRQLALALRGLPTDTASLVARLDGVRIREPERVLGLFPHQISGGMAQRVVIAMTMARTPRLLVADEPTAALDSNVRSEVAKLIFGLATEAGATVLWLSHDLRSVGRWCDRVVVMYGGKVVEDGPAQQVLEHPQHPYTVSLAAADPARATPGERIRTGSFGVAEVAALTRAEKR